MVHSVTKNVLSSYLIHYHFLDCIDRLMGEAGIKSLFQRIGSVQYDPLDIVGRNPHHTWEVYVPAEKRKYGYYVLPVLYQNKLIARMEPVKQKAGPLIIKNWWWEPGVKITKKLQNVVENGLKKFAEYLNVDDIDKKVFKIIWKK